MFAFNEMKPVPALFSERVGFLHRKKCNIDGIRKSKSYNSHKVKQLESIWHFSFLE